MPLVKRLRSRGANTVVVANGELLFVPGSDIARWNNSLSQRVRRFASQEAPSNKRPRWAHYGKPLKQTMRASTDIDTRRMLVHAAIGSTAPYAAYVDQGTGIYSGRGPYQAKILPPWERQSPSLYEHTFRVPTPGRENMHGERVVEWDEVGTVTVKGQKGQFFFDKALRDGFQSMRIATAEFEFGGRGMAMTRALAAFPDHLAGFKGNTPVTGAFLAQLDEWREWRDRSFNAGRILGQGYTRYRERRELLSVQESIRRSLLREQVVAERRERNRLAARRYRERQRANRAPRKPRAKPSLQRALAAARAEMAAWVGRNPGLRIIGYNAEGFRYLDSKGKPRLRPWTIGVADLFIAAGQYVNTTGARKDRGQRSP